MGVEVGGQFEPRNDGPDHGKLQILTRQLHIDGGVPMRKEDFFQQPEVVGGRAEPIIGQFGKAALREASRNRGGGRAVGIRIGGLGQCREQSPCPGKPRRLREPRNRRRRLRSSGSRGRRIPWSCPGTRHGCRAGCNPREVPPTDARRP